MHSYPSVELTLHLWVPQRISYEKVRYRAAMMVAAAAAGFSRMASTQAAIDWAAALAAHGLGDLSPETAPQKVICNFWYREKRWWGHTHF